MREVTRRDRGHPRGNSQDCGQVPFQLPPAMIPPLLPSTSAAATSYLLEKGKKGEAVSGFRHVLPALSGVFTQRVTKSPN